MRTGVAATVGIGIGAGLMYWWDPVGGRRRRARLGQKLSHGAHELTEVAEKGGRDLSHRTRGLAAKTRSWFRRRPLPDETVVERVRAKLGRASAHPGAIEVVSRDGQVELRGPILKSELKRVLSTVARVRGVREVENNLEVHNEPGNIPALQGGEGKTGPTVDLLQTNWAPATRLIAGSAGAALLGFGGKGRGPLGWTFGMVGAGLLARSIVNSPWRRTVGIGAGRRAVDVRKSIHVNAPVQEVFAFWRQLESFPRFMSHVKEVKRTEGDRYHWSVTGPAGVSFEWDAEISRLEPDRLLAWRSVPGASVESAGIVHFTPRNSGTEVDIQLSYRPPGGVIGHGIATLLGAAPKKQMDDDLLRFKSLIEHGKATGRTETVTRDEIRPGKSS